jgi:Domain of unknown function (DUF1854)
MRTSNFQLRRDSYGQLVLTAQNGETHEGIVPVRAFPIAAPSEGIALINAEGHEVGWVDCIADLPPASGQLIEEELASREFVPEIEKILDVSSFACPSTWQVVTNRGDATLLLKGEEDIRRLSQTQMMISDTHGIQFLIRDIGTLDRSSRKLLDRFL